MISGYEIEEKIAETSRSAIYKAYETGVSKSPIVIKALKAIRMSEHSKDQLMQRIERLKVLDHALLIVPGYIGVKDGVFYITRDYYDGVTLDNLAEGFSEMGLKAFLPVACQLAHALDLIHKAGIVHGGIKPHNILINPQTYEIRIIDFISSLDIKSVSHFIHDPSFVRDTLSYTSPEQTGRINHRVGFASDLYSLGIVFYEMLTGCLPFFSVDPLELIHSHLAQEAPPMHEVKPGIPIVLSRITAKLMHKEPGKRYKSPAGLLTDLTRCKNEYEAAGTISQFPPDSRTGPRWGSFVSKMVGRDRETGEIVAEYEKAAAGEFRSMFISGLPGIGKTRLI